MHSIVELIIENIKLDHDQTYFIFYFNGDTQFLLIFILFVYRYYFYNASYVLYLAITVYQCYLFSNIQKRNSSLLIIEWGDEDILLQRNIQRTTVIAYMSKIYS
ncbi:unnamed protein product [Rhizophagus irregularis]|nr:unnamed protein product [Rhizophagus irregularis]CAB5388871.1 unnamed protein product [Rhizophagus irregularis]